MEDNAYPNDGEWFAQPEQRIQDELEEKRKVNNAKPIIQDVLKRLEDRIAFYSTIDAIPADITTEPAVYQRVVEANKVIRDVLTEERQYIFNMLKAK